MDRKLYNKGYQATLKRLSEVNFYHETATFDMLEILRDLDEEIDTIDTFYGARDAFGSRDFRNINALMCVCSPISFMSKLRGLGFVSTISTLMTNNTVYSEEVLNRLKFDDVFIYDDKLSIKRSMINYIMEIPYDSFPLSEKFDDLKTEIWNRCLKIAIKLKEKFNSMTYSVPLDELTQILIDSSHLDAIGNDDIGIETFYNKFVGLCGYDISEICGTDMHSFIISELTEVGRYVTDRFEWFWSTYPQRLMLYIRLKVQTYRQYPDMSEDWSHLDNKSIFVSGKGEW